ncbi:hypothetical protein GCM10011514_10770 [Emticicia aquatilis]|uniref:Uncharacterized protein n=1 Tax=Emticicia aquatilis TaxID=1537369 RepID=A0A916YJH3_9BACT|nr:hypothetical protein [Emticicia aquatilis]GGD48552.1 hypothetical protein GCM10011514_10770 [Emticicia aquatilis]
MQKFIFIGLIACFSSCQNSSNHLSTNPQKVAIAYCQLGNEGIKGDTAKYNLYRKGYLQDNITQKDIFGAMLIYSTAKMTKKGTVISFKNLEEQELKKDASGRKVEVEEKILFIFENRLMDTVVVKLVYDKNVWRLKWQNMDDLERK